MKTLLAAFLRVASFQPVEHSVFTVEEGTVHAGEAYCQLRAQTVRDNKALVVLAFVFHRDTRIPSYVEYMLNDPRIKSTTEVTLKLGDATPFKYEPTDRQSGDYRVVGVVNRDAAIARCAGMTLRSRCR